MDKKYEIVSDEELNNDSQKLYFNVKKEDLDQWQTNDLENFITTGESSYLSHTLFQDLCNRNIIEPGNYLIGICW